MRRVRGAHPPSPKATSAPAVGSTTWWSGFWNTNPAGCAVRTSPPVAATNPPAARSSVLLPHPLAPSSMCSVPSATAKWQSLSTCGDMQAPPLQPHHEGQPSINLAPPPQHRARNGPMELLNKIVLLRRVHSALRTAHNPNVDTGYRAVSTARRCSGGMQRQDVCTSLRLPPSPTLTLTPRSSTASPAVGASPTAAQQQALRALLLGIS